jgi:hypothetical protein
VKCNRGHYWPIVPILTIVPIVPAPDDDDDDDDADECGAVGGMTAGETEVFGGNLSQCNFVHQKSNMT